MPTRRSVTWLVYLNDGWQGEEGGALRCFPRSDDARAANNVQVGCHEGNLQVGWLNNDSTPVFLDVFRESGGAALYQLVSSTEGSDISSNERQILSVQDFNVPGQPIDFSIFLKDEVKDKFEQISTSRLDPRFATASTSASGNTTPTHEFDCTDERNILDIPPIGGTLVVFDSVSLPHLVREVTGKRQRLAATGWFHEDSQFAIEM